MRRWGTFLTGAAMGAVAVYLVLNNHLVRARDGWHLVPKVDARLADTYVDIREFGPRDWLDHPDLFAALTREGQEQLFESAVNDAGKNALDRLLGPRDPQR